jgi:hypothetical protein
MNHSTFALVCSWVAIAIFRINIRVWEVEHYPCWPRDLLGSPAALAPSDGGPLQSHQKDQRHRLWRGPLTRCSWSPRSPRLPHSLGSSQKARISKLNNISHALTSFTSRGTSAECWRLLMVHKFDFQSPGGFWGGCSSKI